MSNLLEDYLHQLRTGLSGLPEEQREDEIEETRQHLIAIIQERVQRGEKEDAATFAAIQQFGSPQANGKALQKMWRRGQHSTTRIERFESASHKWMTVVTIYSVLINLLPYCLWNLHLYSTSRIFSSFRYYLPNLFDNWNLGFWGTLPLSSVLSYTLLGTFAALSLIFSREMRTLFFTVFMFLILSNITLDVVGYSIYRFYHIYVPYFSFPIKIALLLLSSFALTMELVRNKSLLSAPKPRKSA